MDNVIAGKIKITDADRKAMDKSLKVLLDTKLDSTWELTWIDEQVKRLDDVLKTLLSSYQLQRALNQEDSFRKTYDDIVKVQDALDYLGNRKSEITK